MEKQPLAERASRQLYARKSCPIEYLCMRLNGRPRLDAGLSSGFAYLARYLSS